MKDLVLLRIWTRPLNSSPKLLQLEMDNLCTSYTSSIAARRVKMPAERTLLRLTTGLWQVC